jgi:hypothetical protein
MAARRTAEQSAGEAGPLHAGEVMIAFLLWAIVLILFWPVALIIAVAWTIPAFVRVCMFLSVFSIKITAYLAVGIGAITSSLIERTRH